MRRGLFDPALRALAGHPQRVSGAAVLCLAASLFAAAPTIARADENGVSFWLPGFFGSLAAVPPQPGWALATFNYYTSVSAGADISRAREIEIGRFPATLSGTVNLNLHSDADLQALVPSYTFATPLFGGRASVGLMGLYGHLGTDISGTLNGTVTGPGGTSIPFMRTDSIGDGVTGFGDLYPQFALRWNAGVNNTMIYMTGDVPVGAYNAARLSNIGIGHGAFDAGGGYTYFDPQTGHEFSGVLGFTANFINPATQYQNGVDMHFDWGISQFLTKQVQVGLVGYAYKEIGCDSGAGDLVGCFQSQVFSVGPQLGFIFPVGTMQGYLNFKGYKEFAAADRPDGWNAWVTFSLSPAPPASSATTKPIVTK
jgi:hypothetical protein